MEKLRNTKEKFRRLRRRAKNFGEDPQEMAKLYESLQHGNSEEMDLLQPKERLMMELVKEGEIEELRKHLEEFPNLDLNVRDRRGRYPLQLAVDNQDVEMVWFLINVEDRPVKLNDSLLHAVEKSHEGIAFTLLEWKKRKEEDGEIDVGVDLESSCFPIHMTPLMLACINNDYSIIRLLLEKGYKLTDFSVVEKSVGDIPGHIRGETLEAGRQRVDEFRAMSSSVYICLTSDDPILTAFYLIERAGKLAYADPIFKEKYNDITVKCTEFTVALLDECRTSDEIEMLLKKEDRRNVGVAYPRLKLAIDRGIKEFVTHENCQQVMKKIWTQGHPNIMRLGFWSLLFHFLPQLLILPFVYIGYYFFPFLRFFDFYRSPMMKFYGECTSYFVFLCLLFYDTQHRDVSQREPDMLNAVNIFLLLYIICFIWETMQTTYRGGMKYIKDIWLLQQVAMCICFVGSYLFSIISYSIAHVKGPEYSHQERIHWNWTDPMLIAECFYCFALLLAFYRILYPFKISQLLGPVQLYMCKMLTDVLNMLFIFLVTLVSFSMAMTRLYSYYDGMIRLEDGETEEQPTAFSRFRKAFKTLFWNMFGYGEVDDANLVVGNTCSSILVRTKCYNTTKHMLTEATGYSLYALYHTVAIIVLVNGLIALMSNTLSRVQENLDQEWKFDRSTIWMKYLERRRVMPKPLYLIPSPHDVYGWIFWIRKRWFSKRQEAQFMFDKCCYIVDEEKRKSQMEREEKFPKLVERLVARYLSRIEEKEHGQVITSEDLEKATQDLLKNITILSQGKKKSLWRASLLKRVISQDGSSKEET